jgi:hypothetical protein
MEALIDLATLVVGENSGKCMPSSITNLSRHLVLCNPVIFGGFLSFAEIACFGNALLLMSVLLDPVSKRTFKTLPEGKL